MAKILGTQTVDTLLVISTDTNPNLVGGTPAPVGSIVLTADGSGSYSKTGALDTEWTIIGAINIPTPSIQVGGFNSSYNSQNLYAHYLPIMNGGSDFLAHSPKYYLFMAKSRVNHSKKNIGGFNVPKVRNAGFYHPTHQNGINFPSNSPYYGGTTDIPLDTEFSIASTPYTNTLIGFNPFQWTRYNNAVPTLATFGTAPSQWKIQGKRGGVRGHYKRSAMFYLAIGIKNPDATSPYPILFGQPSQLFRLTFRIESSFVVGFSLTVQYSRVKRNP
jgi:hypothetical protein